MPPDGKHADRRFLVGLKTSSIGTGKCWYIPLSVVTVGGAKRFISSYRAFKYLAGIIIAR